MEDDHALWIDGELSDYAQCLDYQDLLFVMADVSREMEAERIARATRDLSENPPA